MGLAASAQISARARSGGCKHTKRGGHGTSGAVLALGSIWLTPARLFRWLCACVGALRAVDVGPSSPSLAGQNPAGRRCCCASADGRRAAPAAAMGPPTTAAPQAGSVPDSAAPCVSGSGGTAQRGLSACCSFFSLTSAELLVCAVRFHSARVWAGLRCSVHRGPPSAGARCAQATSPSRPFRRSGQSACLSSAFACGAAARYRLRAILCKADLAAYSGIINLWDLTSFFEHTRAWNAECPGEGHPAAKG